MGLATIGTMIGASAANAAAAGAAAISVATGLATTAATHIQQTNNAKAQAEAQAKQNQMITEATIENYKDLSKAEQAVLYNAQQDSMENKISALESKSAMEARASATGVRGRSSDMLFNKLSMDKARGDTAIRQSRDQQLHNINQQAIALQTGAEASYDNTPIRKPSAWNSIAAGASAGANMYGTATSLNKAWTDSRRITDVQKTS